MTMQYVIKFFFKSISEYKSRDKELNNKITNCITRFLRNVFDFFWGCTEL